MAEGDTVQRLAIRLGEALAGRTVEEAEAPNPRSPLHRRAARLVGERVAEVQSRGKHLLIGFDGGLALHSHLGMGGSWRIYGPDAGPRRGRSPWLAITVSGGTAAVQSKGPTLRLVRAAELRRDPRLARLGPDLLGPGFCPRAGADALRGGGGELSLGEALLDQTLIAGVGNIYKSEGCFAAGVDPRRRVGELSDGELLEVVERTEALMRAGVASGRQPDRIYRRAGRPCPRCGERIRSGGQGDDNRTTYWCPGCQR
jgi:endonuclease VIII